MKTGSLIINNQLNVPVTVLNCVVNFGGSNNNTAGDGSVIAANGSYSFATTYPNSNFNDFQLQVMVGNERYQIDLNNGHWFGSNNPFHVPGSDSVVSIILTGLLDNGNGLLLMEAFNNSTPGGINYASTDSSKIMNRI